jgi:glutathione S-transferase
MDSDDRTGMTRLHYFKGRGRAETTRWMLAINQIAFENVPVETPKAFATLRATGKLPFDQMPLLEIDGLNLS